MEIFISISNRRDQDINGDYLLPSMKDNQCHTSSVPGRPEKQMAIPVHPEIYKIIF